MKSYVQTELPDDIRDIEVVEMDEIWHFTKKTQWVVAVKKPLKLPSDKHLIGKQHTTRVESLNAHSW